MGDAHRGVSITYSSTVRYVEASDSVMIEPDADHVKISICPGVSTNTYLSAFARFSTNSITWSNRVANKFSDVRMPPFGPSLYCFITSL